MRIDEYHARCRRLPLAVIDDIIGPGCGLIIAPHPDDEALGCGGLIAACCQAKRPPAVVFLTDGAMSHPNSKMFPRERLIRTREQEARTAAAILGLAADRLIFLREPDTKAPRAGNAVARVVNRLAGLADRFGCTCILAPWRFDPHSDHEAAASIAEKVAERHELRHVAYPVWGWMLPPGQIVEASAPVGWRLDIAANLCLKRRAIAAHRSQYGDLITDDPAGFRLPRNLLTIFERPFETFLAP
jgi:LmbE family N-acetylglucosaminyl deacetylase